MTVRIDPSGRLPAVRRKRGGGDWGHAGGPMRRVKNVPALHEPFKCLGRVVEYEDGVEDWLDGFCVMGGADCELRSHEYE